MAMPDRLSRRELLAASLALPAAGHSSSWNTPVPLGKTGLKVTRLAFGCEEVRDPKLIRRAADLGIAYLNCLPPRRENEYSAAPVVREALKPIRGRVVLSSGTSRRSRGEISADLDRHLRAFGTDYLDVFYLIAASKAEHLSDDVLEGLRAARQSGKIRACGVTTHRLDSVLPPLLDSRAIDAVMLTFNFSLADARPTLFQEVIGGGGRLEAIARLRKAGVGIVAMKPLMAGLSKDIVPPERRAWYESLDSVAKRRAALSAALKWAVRSEHVDTAPVLMSSVEQLEANVRTAAEPFTEADLQALAPL
ncbi:MAG TPA: aldo/keto reductase [Bryobacteraceae bacterium]|nr:aldo/keto reductase [Bryobacteraceae bacterium]